MQKNQPCAVVRNGQVTARCCVWLGKKRKRKKTEILTFSTRHMSVKKHKTAWWNKVVVSLTLTASTFKSRAQIVLEKARRRFSVAACHREGGVCVYSNITELAVSRAHGSSLSLWRREGATVWPHTSLQHVCFLQRVPGNSSFVLETKTGLFFLFKYY